MKKLLGILIMFLTFLGAGCHFGHCASATKTVEGTGAAKPLQILATTFPVYLFAANVIGAAPHVQLDILIPATAGCPHDFALKPADLAKLASAKALVINGGGLEEFLEKAIGGLREKPRIIDASSGIKFLKDSTGKDNPHVFASPRLAADMVANIAKELGEFDAANAKLYAANGQAYARKLQALGASLQNVGARAANKGIALEHDALAYIAADAGLNVLAEVQDGASAAQLANLKKLILAKKPALLAADSQYPDKLMQTLAVETMLPYASLDPCASGPDKAPLDFYETTMTRNIKTLEQYFDK